MEYVDVQGVEVPALGFGTWQMRGEQCRVGVEEALELGYRHIDTAQAYDNEEVVGDAVGNAGVDRSEVFLATKVARRNLARDDVLSSVEGSLDRLGTTIDLLLIHAPSRRVPIGETIGAMNRLQEEGSVRHIGVSNFSVGGMEAAIEASETPILTNQVEYHPFRSRGDLLSACIEHDVMLTAYSPVDQGGVVGNEVLGGIGDRYGKTEAQVALRWLLQQDNVSAIPKAASGEHRAENFDVLDFELSDGEMARIFELGGGIDAGLRDEFGI